MMKPGYKTTGFYLSLAAIFLGHLVLSQVIPGGFLLKTLGLFTQILGAAGYTWSRSALKIGAVDGSEMKPGWKSTEFIISALSSILGAITASGAIQSESVIQALGLVQTNIVAAIYLLFRNRVETAHIVDAKERKAMEGQSIRTVVQ